MITRCFVFSVLTTSFLFYGCSNNSGQKTIDSNNQELFSQIDSAVNHIDECDSRHDVNSLGK